METTKRPAIGMPKLAYKNPRFMESGEARTLRIVSEYMEPQVRLRRAGIQHTVVFFGSARILPRDEALRRLQDLERQSKDSNLPDASSRLQRARKVLKMSRYYEDARVLARMVTKWALEVRDQIRLLVVCSGGGPGIMEAANRGAAEAGGKSIGLNIQLPEEQLPNPYITPELNFLFRYFFMRKLWFAQPARALIVFPGGFGTMDELWEFLTLIQTHKFGHQVSILLYGSKFWKRAINFDWLVEAGTVDENELRLIRFADHPREAFEILQGDLSRILGVRPLPKHPFL
jgi:uncharacterized protein (TIGR00730 family)